MAVGLLAGSYARRTSSGHDLHGAHAQGCGVKAYGRARCGAVLRRPALHSSGVRRAGEGAEAGQRPGRPRAAQVAVGDDRAGVGAVGSAVVGMQVLDELGSGGAQRHGPVPGNPVGVARVVQDIAEGMPPVAIRCRTGTMARAGSRGRRSGSSGGRTRGRAARFLSDHGPGRQVVAVEQLVFLAGAVAAAVSPGRFGIGAVPASGRRPGRRRSPGRSSQRRGRWLLACARGEHSPPAACRGSRQGPMKSAPSGCSFSSAVTTRP